MATHRTCLCACILTVISPPCQQRNMLVVLLLLPLVYPPAMVPDKHGKLFLHTDHTIPSLIPHAILSIDRTCFSKSQLSTHYFSQKTALLHTDVHGGGGMLFEFIINKLPIIFPRIVRAHSVTVSSRDMYEWQPQKKNSLPWQQQKFPLKFFIIIHITSAWLCQTCGAPSFILSVQPPAAPMFSRPTSTQSTAKKK